MDDDFLEPPTPDQARLLATMMDARMPPIERAEAGRALAEIGDPRTAAMALDGMEFGYVPAGRFWLGSKAHHYEQPPSWHDIPYAYWMGRFPVTQAQFDVFVADNGYRDERWWGVAIAAGHWTSDGYVMWKGVSTPRAAQYPRDTPFTLPNHPAVDVSWYEWHAFAAWLTARWRDRGYLSAQERVVMPAETEWEKAARGGEQMVAEPIVRPIHDRAVLPAIELVPNPDPRRRYPYGNTASPRKGNYEETGIGTTTAVGIFAAGASPYGCEEMSGWPTECTRSVWYMGYPNDPAFETMVESGIARSGRGGYQPFAMKDARCPSKSFVHVSSGGWYESVRLAIVTYPAAPRTPRPDDWEERDRWVLTYEPPAEEI